MNKSKSNQSKIENHNELVNHLNREDQREIVNNESQNMLAELGKLTAGSYYEHQSVRMAEMNRMRDIIYRKMEGLNLLEIQEKKPEEEKYLNKFQDKYLNEYIRILEQEGKITEIESEYLNKVVEVQKNAEKYEVLYKSLMADYVENELIYKEFLEKIKGISSVLSANLLKEFGYCENAPHISSLWKYCGMHVDMIEGEEGETIGVAPKRQKGQKLEFNLKLRTLCYKIGDSFIKQRTPFYRDIYDVEKARQLKLMEDSQGRIENHVAKTSHKKQGNQASLANHTNIENQFLNVNQYDAENHTLGVNQGKVENLYMNVKPTAPKSLLHADLRARRKMVKIFLAHYWMCAKELKPMADRKPFKLSESMKMSKPYLNSDSRNVRKPIISYENMPYVQAKLGHKHITSWRDAVALQNQKKEVLKVEGSDGGNDNE